MILTVLSKKAKVITEMNIGNGLLLKYVIPNKE